MYDTSHMSQGEKDDEREPLRNPSRPGSYDIDHRIAR
jgi:hypothetical protein